MKAGPTKAKRKSTGLKTGHYKRKNEEHSHPLVPPGQGSGCATGDAPMECIATSRDGSGFPVREQRAGLKTRHYSRRGEINRA